jgi:hypothetical protein
MWLCLSTLNGKFGYVLAGFRFRTIENTYNVNRWTTLEINEDKFYILDNGIKKFKSMVKYKLKFFVSKLTCKFIYRGNNNERDVCFV